MLPHALSIPFFSDAARRIVDYAPQSLVVVRVDRHTEIAQSVFYLLALIKRQSAIDAVRHIALSEAFLQQSRLGVGAVEYGKIIVLPDSGIFISTILFATMKALLIVGHRLDYGDSLSHGIHREYPFRYLVAVFLYQAVCHIKYRLRRTIVLLQFERLQTGIIRLESQDVLNVGASKRVDALRVVANNTHLVVHTAQLLHHKMLREIGVLILVDKNILEKF